VTDHSNPDRDRYLARQVRYGYRRATGAAQILNQWWTSEDGKRLRRLKRLAGALRSVLSDPEFDKIEPVSLKAGVLTLAVSDTMLLSELRNHRHGELVAALVEQGTGINRVVYRLKRRPAGR
jgi:hypothetical protein